MGIHLALSALIHFHEMLLNFLKIENTLKCQNARMSDVLHVMAPITESNKTFERLNTFLIIIFPDLVTIEAPRVTTYATQMPVVCIRLLPYGVPDCRGKL